VLKCPSILSRVFNLSDARFTLLANSRLEINRADTRGT
jgi:hypothetical protein